MSDNRLDFFSYTPPYGPEDMQREIDILRAALAKSNAERDEARRMYCYAIPENCDEHEARKIAWERGWDCFKEDGK